MSVLPTGGQVRELPSYFEQAVTDDFIDENGHMNIGDYFRLATWAPWKRLTELGLPEDYIAVRGMSFFTVEHHIRYLGELRLGEGFAVHTGFVGRTDKALHSASFVLDTARDRIACVLEVMYVHVSMAGRRAATIPEDVAAWLDTDIAPYAGWLPKAADGLALRR